jgi:dihydroorotate dehydrogenase
MSYYPPQNPQPYYPPPTQTSSLAIVSLVAGIMTWSICPGLAGIVAIITGHIAKGQIKDSQGRQTGDGLATAGLILGYAQIVLSIVGLCIYLVFVLGIFGIAGLGGALQSY